MLLQRSNFLTTPEERIAFHLEDAPANDDTALMPDYGQVLWQDAKHYALYGGRGGGKSWVIARFLLIRGAEEPLRIACCREIQKNIDESVYQLLVDQIIALGLEDHYTVHDKEIVGNFHDTLFTFHGLWRNPTGLKSMEGYDYCWIEEAAAASKQSIRVLIPTLRKNTSKFIWSWNPEYEHDAVELLFRDLTKPEATRLPPRTVLVKVGHEDNPWFPDVLREEMDNLYANDPDMADHVYGGDYIKTVDGAYFAQELRQARLQGRFSNIVYDPSFEVKAFWDLGSSDATAIWIVQFVGENIHVIDYIEGAGHGPGYYMAELRRAGYDKCTCYIPHDGAHVHADNPRQMSYEAQLKEAGFPTKLVANQGKNAAQQRIDAMRRIFPRMHFNEDATKPGVRALGHYHEKIHENSKARMGPEHDWSSHASDAAGIIALTFTPPKKKLEPGPKKPKKKSAWAM